MTTPRELIAQYATQSQLSSFFIDKIGIISVKEYGATGDGATSDTTNVQNAINAAQTAGITEVYFPHGTYYVTALTNTSGITFVGDNSSFTGGYKGQITNYATYLSKINENVDFHWNGDTQIKLWGVNTYNKLLVELDGLYFNGKNVRNQVIKRVTVDSSLVGDITTGLDAGLEKDTNWYAVFLVEKSDGTVGLAFSTFIRVLSDASNVITFAKHRDKTTAIDYGFTANDLANLDCILLADGAVTHTNIGALRTITASTATTLTYNSTSLSLTQGAWLMVAPKGYTYYKYIGAIHNDSSSNFMNFSKFGKKYDSYSYAILSGGTSDAYAAVDINGATPPTARTFKVRMVVTSINSPAAGGNMGVYLSTDSSDHATLDIIAVTQNIVAAQTVTAVGEITPMFPQTIYYKKATSDTANVTLNIRGWIE